MSHVQRSDSCTIAWWFRGVAGLCGGLTGHVDVVLPISFPQSGLNRYYPRNITDRGAGDISRKRSSVYCTGFSGVDSRRANYSDVAQYLSADSLSFLDGSATLCRVGFEVESSSRALEHGRCFVISVLASLSKLIGLADLEFGVGFWAYMLFAGLVLVSLWHFDRAPLWHWILPDLPHVHDHSSATTV